MFDKIRNYINDNDWKINISKNKVNIVNYLDISLLQEDKISIKYQEGYITIVGEKLSINKMFDSEILITGNIKGINFSWLSYK